MASQSKDSWDKAQVIASFVIPLVIAVSAWWLDFNLKNRELEAQESANERNRAVQKAATDRNTRLRTFEVAVGILQKDPKSNGNSTSALRKWAIKTFADFSGQKVPEEVKKELESRPLPSPPGIAPRILSFSADKSITRPGESVRLSWRTHGAERVVITPGEFEAVDSPEAGSVEVWPEGPTTYTLWAYGGGIPVSSQLTVDVPPPPN